MYTPKVSINFPYVSILKLFTKYFSSAFNCLQLISLNSQVIGRAKVIQMLEIHSLKCNSNVWYLCIISGSVNTYISEQEMTRI